MSDYTITTNFGAKDSLPSGNAGKVIKGSDFTTEFTNIQTAVATKADTAGDTFTGAVNFSADVAVNTNTLFVDVSEAKVGIGTTSPTEKLQVNGNIKIGDSHIIGNDAFDNLTLISSSPEGIVYGSNTDHIFKTGATGLGATGTERMRINSTGNVGIGTTNPSEALEVNGNLAFSGGSDKGIIGADFRSLNIFANPNDSAEGIKFSTDGGTTTEVFIQDGGNVGIGTTSPTFKLDVAGNARASYFALRSNETVPAESSFIYRPATGVLGFGTGTEERMRIDSSGQVGIGTTSPDSILDVVGADPILTVRDTSTSGADSHATLRLAESGASDSLNLHYDISLDEGNLTFNYDNTGSNPTERMRIDSSGQVGIGTTNPACHLNVSGSGNGSVSEHVRITSTDTDSKLAFVNTTGNSAIVQSGQDMRFMNNTANTERMRIDSSGIVLVGKTAHNFNAQGIELRGSPSSFASVATFTRDGQNAVAFKRLTNNGSIVDFSKDDTTVGTISVTGSATAYNTSSDERLKENITDSADAGSKVDAIQIRQFDWKVDGSHQDYGVIAQELINVAPEAVSEGDTEEDMMGVDYSKLVPMLIKEVQSLRSRVAELENV